MSCFGFLFWQGHAGAWTVTVRSLVGHKENNKAGSSLDVNRPAGDPSGNDPSPGRTGESYGGAARQQRCCSAFFSRRRRSQSVGALLSPRALEVAAQSGVRFTRWTVRRRTVFHQLVKTTSVLPTAARSSRDTKMSSNKQPLGIYLGESRFVRRPRSGHTVY